VFAVAASAVVSGSFFDVVHCSTVAFNEPPVGIARVFQRGDEDAFPGMDAQALVASVLTQDPRRTTDDHKAAGSRTADSGLLLGCPGHRARSCRLAARGRSPPICHEAMVSNLRSGFRT
jgi:hypothetical protein